MPEILSQAKCMGSWGQFRSATWGEGWFFCVVKQKNAVTQFKWTGSAQRGAVVFVCLINVSLASTVPRQQGWPVEQTQNAASPAWGSEQNLVPLNGAGRESWRPGTWETFLRFQLSVPVKGTQAPSLQALLPQRAARCKSSPCLSLSPNSAAQSTGNPKGPAS